MLEDLKATFQRWLHIKDWQAIDIVLASVLSIFIPGDPVWLFLVKPPGGCGTELLRAFSGDFIYPLSSLTPHTLHSGKPGEKGILHELDAKVMVVKDFTSILGLRDTDRNQIFSDLRDAYDGYSDKFFGSGVQSRAVARFGIVAAVTSAIDMYRVAQGVLGERFLKVRMKVDEEEAVRQARLNTGREHQMREELQQAVSHCIDHYRPNVPTVRLCESLGDRIEALAILTARLRSSVLRDRQHIVQYEPEAEVGTRLVKQLEKLAQALACLHDKEQAGEREYTALVRVARDTIDPQRWKLVSQIATEGTLSTKELAERARMPINTAREHLENAMMLRITDRTLDSDEYQWSLDADVLTLLVKAHFITAHADQVVTV